MSKVSSVVDVKGNLVTALESFLSLEPSAEPTTFEKVAVLHANDLLALLKPMENADEKITA